jgi:HrpA-like RNA helicase
MPFLLNLLFSPALYLCFMSVKVALHSLFVLGAIDQTRSLTKIGREMAALPLEPALARTVLASRDHKCTFEILDIISILSSTAKLFLDPSDQSQRDAASDARKAFMHPSGDHLTILNVVRAYDELHSSENGNEGKQGVGKSKGLKKDWCKRHWVNERALKEGIAIREQLRHVCERLGIEWAASSGEDDAPVLKSLLRGLVQNSALLQPDGTYKQVLGRAVRHTIFLIVTGGLTRVLVQAVKVHPGSVLMDKKVPAIIYNELVSHLFDVQGYTNHSAGTYNPNVLSHCVFRAAQLLSGD